MRKKVSIGALAAAALLLSTGLAGAQSSGTAAEARAMLEKAIAALKANEAEALKQFSNPAGGFKDRDLYVFCFNTSDGKFTAHLNPALMGTDVRTLKAGDDPLGQRIFDTIKDEPEGKIGTIDYKFPRPGTTEAVDKQSFLVRVGNEGCGGGYYK